MGICRPHAITRRTFVAAGGVALAGACLPRRARAGELVDPEDAGGLASLRDAITDAAARAFEQQDLSGVELSGVEWRFDRYAREHDPELHDATLWAYGELARRYRANGLASLAVGLADRLAHTGESEPDQDLYEEVLLTVIALQDTSGAADVRVQAGFDDLKDAGDWIGEAGSALSDVLTVVTGTGAASAFVDALDKVLGAASVGFENGRAIGSAFNQLQALARNYDSYDLFLATVQDRGTDTLAGACASLREHLSSTFGLRLEQAGDVVSGLQENVGEELFDNYLVDSMKNAPLYGSSPAFAGFVDKAGTVLDRVNLLQDSWELGALVGKNVGQILIGGEDLIARLREVCALADIGTALQDALVETQRAFYEAAKAEQVEQAEALACTYVHLAQFLVTVHLRGVYCEHAIVAEDAGLWGLVHAGNREAATAWYDECCARLDVLAKRLGKIPLRGVGAQNNGGEFVGVGDTTYFVRHTPDSVAPDGLFAYFAPTPDGTCSVERIDGDGQLRGPVCLVGGTDGLWLSYDLLFEQSAGVLYACDVTEGILRDCGDTLVPACMDDLTGTLVCTDYNDNGSIVTFARTGTRTKPPVAEDAPQVLCADEGTVYYATVSSTDETALVCVYALDLLLDSTVCIGTASLPCPTLCAVSLSAQATRQKLYLAAVAVGGTGSFYGPGGLWSFDLLGQGQTLLIDPYDEELCCNAPVFCVGRDADGSEALHFYGGPSYSGAGSGLAPWIAEDLWRVDLRALETAPSSLPALTEPGGFAFIDGDLMVPDPAGENVYRLMASAQTFADLGYPAIQDLSAANSTEGTADMDIVARVDVTGKKAYVTVHRTHRNTALDLGWRPGFERVASTVYAGVLGTGQLEELFAF